ncbi:protein IWS1 homolog isoform X3 [Dermacentor albipictus]|uniref:protein IWS1 homolog isoform X3 n=1 Tax=Dermacentor albipictus TaxID=60249 RepID=UPI0038FD1605
MPKSRSRTSLRDETDETRHTTRSRHDDRSVSRGSDLGHAPPSGREATGKAGATAATSRLGESVALSPARSSTKGGRSPSRTTTGSRDESQRQRGSDERHKVSDVRGEGERHESQVSRASDLHSTRRTRSLDEDVERATGPGDHAAGARAAKDRPTITRAKQTSPTRRTSVSPGVSITPVDSRTPPSAFAKVSKGSTRSDDAVSRGSLPDRVSPPRKSSSKNSKIRSDESQSDRRSGALSPRTPRDRSSLPHKMPSKVSQDGHVKPAPTADTAVKPSGSTTKQKAGLICCGCGRVLALPTPTDGTTADKDAQKPAEGAARGRDIEHSMHGESEEEESEETPQPKFPESLPSEDYVPTSEAGQVAPQVVESLGPFSDDDDEEYEGEGDYYEDSSIGWFRTWVLCSVAAIVLMVPFALTFMSYEAAGRLHGKSTPPFAVEGVNVDWDHPSDAHDETKGKNVHDLLAFLGGRQVPMLVTVPPDADIVKRYFNSLRSASSGIQYVIVATHRLRAVGFVSCAGGQKGAARAYWTVRNVLGPKFYKKLIYSVALGGDVFASTKLGIEAPAQPLSCFYGDEIGIPKVRFADVCLMTEVNKTDECALYTTEASSAGYKVVALAGIEELKKRRIPMSGYQMGLLPIVVYDIHLDDYEAVCKYPRWPLLRAIAEPVNIDIPSGK